MILSVELQILRDHKYIDPDVALSILSGVFHDAAKLCLKTKKIDVPEKINSLNTVKNPVLLAVKMQFKRARRCFAKEKSNLNRRQEFFYS